MQSVRSETIVTHKNIALLICRHSDLCILIGLFYLIKLIMEDWKQLEEHYQISNHGRVRNNQTGKVLKPIKCNEYKSKVTLTLENNSKRKDIFLAQ